jgi:3-isopropylmalate dehydratase small subunit
LGADGGLYYSMEFSGPGVGALSLESRMVIPNSMAEIGVKNAWLPPDQAVLDYLGARGIAPASLEARALFPDPDAVYAAEYDLHLDRLEPLVACPHSVDNVQPLSAAAGQRVDMAFIGTCTNGRLEDLAAAAEVLRGRRVDPGTRLLVIPASSQVYQQALREGLIEILVEAGAVIGVPGCGPCMGNHLGIPAKGETVISAANRNFRGRMGQPEAGIFLASPAVVAASAVLGRIGGPAELQGGRKPLTTKDTKGTKGHKETMELKTHSPHSSIRSIRVESSRTDAQVPTVASEARQPTSAASGASGRTWKYGDNVNTDQIFPGKYTYTVTAPEEIAAHAMEDLDPGFASEVRAGDVVFGGSNFGCGSSREQAVTCLKHKGVAALVAESFARIFFRNAINQGLPAIVSPEAVAAARVGDPVQVDLDAGLIRLPAATYAFPAFPPNVQEILKAGGLVEYMRARAR